MRCPECGSRNVHSRGQHNQHICRECDCVFTDDDLSEVEVLHHGTTFGKKDDSGSIYDMPECHPDWR